MIRHAVENKILIAVIFYVQSCHFTQRFIFTTQSYVISYQNMNEMFMMWSFKRTHIHTYIHIILQYVLCHMWFLIFALLSVAPLGDLSNTVSCLSTQLTSQIARRVCGIYPTNCDHFHSHGLNLIPAWKSNYMHYKMWDEIPYTFLKYNRALVEV